MKEDIHQQLRKALAPVSKHHAQRAGDPQADIEIYAAPFLKRYRIYRINYFGGRKVDLFYVAVADGLRAYVLTPYPENYIAMAREEGLVIDDPETAVNYVTVYVEVTRSMSSLSYLVQSVDEVRFRPNLTPEQEEVKGAFIERYRSVITGPTANPVAGGFDVFAYTVREQVLEQHRFQVSRDGDIQDAVNVLEQNLPLVYGA